MLGVRISSLTHEFDGREVFSSIDFAYDGSCLAITGPNGSGKSTLLRILSGLMEPISGEARLMIGGSPVSRQQARSVVGLCAPDIKLYPELSARENLLFLLKARGASDAERMSTSALEEVGLADRGDDPVRELSSGMRQRAALAAAVAHDPTVLLLDEPSSNLDEPGIRMVRALIDARRRKGLVVIATNDADEAAIADRTLDLRSVQ